jgi:hypothetical protein
MKAKIVHRSLFTAQWKRVFGRHRHRWKIVTPSYIRCDVANGIDLAQGTCKPRMNVHLLCNVGSLLGNFLLDKRAVLWAAWPKYNLSTFGRNKFSLIFKASKL